MHMHTCTYMHILIYIFAIFWMRVHALCVHADLLEARVLLCCRAVHAQARKPQHPHRSALPLVSNRMGVLKGMVTRRHVIQLSNEQDIPHHLLRGCLIGLGEDSCHSTLRLLRKRFETFRHTRTQATGIGEVARDYTLHSGGCGDWEHFDWLVRTLNVVQTLSATPTWFIVKKDFTRSKSSYVR